MQVTQVFNRPASQAFSVAGRLLFIESFNLKLHNSIELLFAGWQLTPVPFADKSPDIRINFFCGDKKPDIPDNLNQFEIAGGGQGYTADGVLCLALRGSLRHLKETSPVAVEVWIAALPDPTGPLLLILSSFAVCAAVRR